MFDLSKTQYPMNTYHCLSSKISAQIIANNEIAQIEIICIKSSKVRTYVSSWIRFVSTKVSTTLASEPLEPDSPFSLVLLDSDLCELDEEGRSSSKGFGCIRVKGNSATSSLKYSTKGHWVIAKDNKGWACNLFGRGSTSGRRKILPAKRSEEQLNFHLILN